VGTGPIVIGFDGTSAGEHAVREAGELLKRREAVVAVVWKQGLAFELMELPAATIGLPPAPIDVRTALEIDQQLFERAQRLAEHGAQLARELGLDAEPLAVAEDPDVSIAETLIRLARERDSQAIVVAPHRHGAKGPLVLGSTSRDVVRHAPCPVVMATGDGA
jgi:nucleotide-binding universal stress UspA family protein